MIVGTEMWWVGEGIERGRYQVTKATINCTSDDAKNGLDRHVNAAPHGQDEAYLCWLGFCARGVPQRRGQTWSPHYLHEPSGDRIGCTSAVDKPVHEIPARLREC
jgi:hypothetical protein